MKLFAATVNAISNVQLATGLLAIAGLFYFDLTLTNLLIALAFFYAYQVVGIGIGLHRYYAHKNFVFRFEFAKWLFTLLAVLAGRGSIISWVYIHRIHHANSDTEKDPHGPKNTGFRLVSFKNVESISGKMNIFVVKDLMTKDQIFIHDYYFAIILAFVVLVSLFSVELAYFVWVLPVFLVQLSQSSFNYFGHTSGYRNYETRDNSRNNFMLWPLIMGDAWHNNHHGNPASMTTQKHWWEVDPAGYIIRTVSK